MVSFLRFVIIKINMTVKTIEKEPDGSLIDENVKGSTLRRHNRHPMALRVPATFFLETLPPIKDWGQVSFLD